jgi:PPM family protein phosphatase
MGSLMHIGFKTDRGLKRERNEDHVLADPRLGLFIVADGMGGHAAGELASSIAVAEIASHIRTHLGRSKVASVVVAEAIVHANGEIMRNGLPRTDGTDMGSTVVLGLIRENRLIISHVGDSRAYLITDGAMTQLTHDHSFVADWVRDGRISIQEARSHPSRHGLYSALGVDDEVEFETSEWPWDSYSCLLLCSDGLTEMLTDDRIAAIVNSADSPQDACERLVEEANIMGGADNISVIVVRQTDEHFE